MHAWTERDYSNKGSGRAARRYFKRSVGKFVSSEENIVEHQIGRLLIGAAAELPLALCKKLLGLCTDSGSMRRGGVVGPQGITRHQIDEVGRVVVKHYVRGGLLR